MLIVLLEMRTRVCADLKLCLTLHFEPYRRQPVYPQLYAQVWRCSACRKAWHYAYLKFTLHIDLNKAVGEGWQSQRRSERERYEEENNYGDCEKARDSVRAASIGALTVASPSATAVTR